MDPPKPANDDREPPSPWMTELGYPREPTRLELMKRLLRSESWNNPEASWDRACAQLGEERRQLAQSQAPPGSTTNGST